jgi:hypothetical protein
MPKESLITAVRKQPNDGYWPEPLIHIAENHVWRMAA